jgi:hypothetical protein
MRIERRFLCVALALSAVLALGSSAQADLVTFVTTGVFTGGSNTTSGTATYTDAANGVLIRYIPSTNNTVTVPPASQVSFGTFNTTGTTATTNAPVSGTFTLNIFQTAPTAGNVSFAGSVSGTLTGTSSQAFVQFNAPLSRVIGTETYTIVSADGGTAGRVNFAPPSTNAGVSTINGSVNSVIPEPSSLVLSALLAPALLALVARTRRSVHSAQL